MTKRTSTTLAEMATMSSVWMPLHKGEGLAGQAWQGEPPSLARAQTTDEQRQHDLHHIEARVHGADRRLAGDAGVHDDRQLAHPAAETRGFHQGLSPRVVGGQRA